MRKTQEALQRRLLEAQLQREATLGSSEPAQPGAAATSSDPAIDPHFTPGRFSTPPRAFSRRSSPAADSSAYTIELRQLQDHLTRIEQRMDRTESQLFQGQATLLVQHEAIMARLAQIDRRLEAWERATRGDAPPPDLGDGIDF